MKRNFAVLPYVDKFLLATLILAAGCTSTPTPNPIASTPPITVRKLAVAAPDAAAGVLITNVTLAWTASTSPGVSAYRLYQGVTSGNYTNSVDVGNVTQSSIPVPFGLTNYITATSVTTNGLESVYAPEMSFVAAPAAPSPVVAYLVAIIQTNSTLNTNLWATMTNLPMVTLTNPPPLLFYRVDMKINYGGPP